MKIAVIGGGIFGCTAAIEAARVGHSVTIFERAGALMQCASGINQLRLHRGYHYPRSPETVAECLDGQRSFLQMYRSAVLHRHQLYAIAKRGSKTGAVAYSDFCRRHGLAHRPARDAWSRLNSHAIDAVWAVDEPSIDLHELRSLVVSQLITYHVTVDYSEAPDDVCADFDRIIVAAYAGTNAVTDMLGLEPDIIQFEVVEKPVLRMPADWAGVGLVILDGPFCSLDPFAKTGLHLMGHVVHAIHSANTGYEPEVPESLVQHLNRSVISVNHLAGITKFPLMQEAGERFIPALADGEHLGSMFTVRAVLPNRDATDERPTLVHRLDDQTIRVFSGKIGTAVQAARQALAMIEERKLEAA